MLVWWLQFSSERGKDSEKQRPGFLFFEVWTGLVIVSEIMFEKMNAVLLAISWFGFDRKMIRKNAINQSRVFVSLSSFGQNLKMPKVR